MFAMPVCSLACGDIGKRLRDYSFLLSDKFAVIARLLLHLHRCFTHGGTRNIYYLPEIEESKGPHSGMQNPMGGNAAPVGGDRNPC